MSKYPLSLRQLKGDGWVEADNLHTLSERLAGNVKPPQTVSKIDASGAANALPTPDNDGSYIVLPASSTGVLARYTGLAAPVWTVARTDIDVGAEYWTPFVWLDTVDACLYVMTLDNGSNTWTLAKIALSDGGVTVIGTATAPAGFMVYGYFDSLSTRVVRAAAGSGDFTVDYAGYRITLSSGSGAILSGPTQITQAGVSVKKLVYASADGNVLINMAPTRFASTAPSTISTDVQRGGSVGRYSLDGTNHIGNLQNYTGPTSFIVWGDCVAGYSSFLSGSDSRWYGARFFDRTDFDRWINDIAELLGLPAA